MLYDYLYMLYIRLIVLQMASTVPFLSFLLLPQEDTASRELSVTGSSLGTKADCILTLGVQSPEMWEINVCYLLFIHYQTFCYSDTEKPHQRK